MTFAQNCHKMFTDKLTVNSGW